MEQGKLLNIVITGTNKGLGYELIKQICELQKKEIKYNLIMTSRDQERGQKAYNQFLQLYPEQKNNLVYHLLDITKKESIEEFYNWYAKNFQRLDILVNNGALGNSDWNNKNLQSQELIDTLMNCNVYGTIDLTEKMLPLLSDNGKIVTVSSELGKLSFQGEKGRKILSDPTMTREKFYEIIEHYRKIGPTQEVFEYYSPKSYFFSKAAINAYNRFILSKLMKKDQLALTVHPGWCRTDLGTQAATLSAGEGAEAIRFVMLDIPFKANEQYQGSFWVQSNRKGPSEF